MESTFRTTVVLFEIILILLLGPDKSFVFSANDNPR